MDFARTLADLLFALRLRKARALFLHLIADPQQVHRTERFLDLFWQGVQADKAALSCRQTVRQLRVALAQAPGILLDTGGGTIALRLPPDLAGQMPLDRMLAQRLAGPGWDDAAAASLRAILTATETVEGLSASFDSWLAITRAGLLSAVRRALDARLAGPGDDPASRQAAEFALELEPANEVAVRHLMTLDWREGHPTRAIARYDTLYRHLDADYDQEPEPETIGLLAAIKLDPGGGSSHSPPPPPPQVPLALVLDPAPGLAREWASLAAVLAADLRLRMDRFREWRVLDDSAPEAPRIRVVLRPGLTADGFSLAVQVRQGADDQLLWDQDIPQPSRDWEAKVRPLLTGIANALSVVVAERALQDRAASVYDRWLRAQVLLDDWSPVTEAEAMDMLRQITLEEPRFGPAHAELAGALNVSHILRPGTYLTPDQCRTALHHALEAVQIDPLDTRAHRVLAWCYCYRDEFELAGFHFEQALALNPANVMSRASAALGHAFADDLDRARALADELAAPGVAILPFQTVYLAAVNYLCGRPDLAAAQCAQAGALHIAGGGWHTAALWHLGQREAAEARFAAWLDDLRPNWFGDRPHGAEAVVDWFVAIFPLRRPATRTALRATLTSVAEGLGAAVK